jgi:hypothetical protein
MAISLSGEGLVFPASFSNSTNANTMDDYEEAYVSDPTIRYSGNSNQAVRANNSMYYVKMGKGFIGQWEAQVTSTNSGTGAMEVSLPFSSQEYGAYGIRTYSGNFDHTYRQAMVTESNSSYYQAQEFRSGASSVGLITTGYFFSGWVMVCPYSSPFLG